VSSFGGDNLFGSGVHSLDVGPSKLRHSLDEASGWDGAAMQSGGREPRRMILHGGLIADTVGGLEAQRAAIEAVMDGQPRVLIDDLERSWDAVVLVAFEPEPIRAVGTRWRMDYEARFVQVKP